jgi:4-amino-4-deoxy-L-arabinose transferase-like glycosyltransferase
MNIAAEKSAARWKLLLLGYFCVYFLFWTLAPFVQHQAPPDDNLEQLDWVRHLAFGYPKHPPFPTWILGLAQLIAPSGVPLTFALGAAEVGALLALAYWVGRKTLGNQAAVIGALMMTCITYYTLRMGFYNHNTALMVGTAAAMTCTWQASTTNLRRWWVLLGVCWAAGMLSKYQMAVSIVCNVAFLLWDTDRRPRNVRGGAIAAAVGVALFVPHILWLIQNHFPSFDYAAKSLAAHLPVGARLHNLLAFLANQVLRLMPAAALAAILQGLAARRASPRAIDAHDNPRAERFWAIHAFAPFIIMACMGVLAGVDLEMHWGTAFLWVWPLWFLSTARGRRLAAADNRSIALAAIAVQSLLIVGKILLPDV